MKIWNWIKTNFSHRVWAQIWQTSKKKNEWTRAKESACMSNGQCSSYRFLVILLDGAFLRVFFSYSTEHSLLYTEHLVFRFSLKSLTRCIIIAYMRKIVFHSFGSLPWHNELSMYIITRRTKKKRSMMMMKEAEIKQKCSQTHHTDIIWTLFNCIRTNRFSLLSVKCCWWFFSVLFIPFAFNAPLVFYSGSVFLFDLMLSVYVCACFLVFTLFLHRLWVWIALNQTQILQQKKRVQMLQLEPAHTRMLGLAYMREFIHFQNCFQRHPFNICLLFSPDRVSLN